MIYVGCGGVGWDGMLTFAARCTRCGCYVADGLGWGGVGCGGMLTFAARCTRCAAFYVHTNPGLDNVLKALKISVQEPMGS